MPTPCTPRVRRGVVPTHSPLGGDGGTHVTVSVPSALISCAEILAGTQRSHRAARRLLHAAKILRNLLPCVAPSQVSIGLRGSRC